MSGRNGCVDRGCDYVFVWEMVVFVVDMVGVAVLEVVEWE